MLSRSNSLWRPRLRAVRRRHRPAVPVPRRGGVDERAARGRRARAASSCRGTRACTAAPGSSRSQATAAYEEARAAALRVRRTGRAAATSRSSAATPPRRSTTSPTGCGSQPRRRRRDHRGRAPRQPAAVGAARARAASSSAAATARSPSTTSIAALDAAPRPRLLAITGASNVTGWLPPLDAIIDAAHERGVPVLVDAAQLAPHRPLPADRRLRRLERPQDVRAVRRRRAHRSPATRSPTAIRSWPAAAPSTSSISTRSCGPSRPSARRPARPT